MTTQEVIEQLKAMYPKTSRMVDGRYTGGFDDHNSKGGIALDMAIEALEKQIPKEPRFYNANYYCPECDDLVGCKDTIMRWEHNYCMQCGQAIKWE